MERVQLTEDLQFSRIIHGHWRMADWQYGSQQILRVLEECLEMGVTTMDTADIYGQYTCESLFGQALALKPSLRDSIEIVTKCGIKLTSKEGVGINHYDSSKKHIIESVEASLLNLHTDYLDAVLIHRPDVLTDPEEVAAAFSELKRAGKVRSFGVSNYTPSQLNMLQSYLDEPLITNQVEVSLLVRDQFENGTLDQAIEKRMPVMAWSPLAGGRIFTGEDAQTLRVQKALKKTAAEMGTENMDQVLYAWLLKHPGKIMPIVGSGKVKRIRAAVGALQLKMTKEQWYELWVASRGKPVD
ncbi:aldo/keto reductase [Bacillus testis]|uniref:aldo/keto reductase n=1 Tax=Bacillus testis TaxID=1622072 RepID=UPI00067E66EB|nr:aldo/keto reductase [Bacillus testis]